MFDMTAPNFHGTDAEKMRQMADYITQLHAALARKFVNIDLSDMNADTRSAITGSYAEPQ